jgi:hypothetical protein
MERKGKKKRTLRLVGARHTHTHVVYGARESSISLLAYIRQLAFKLHAYDLVVASSSFFFAKIEKKSRGYMKRSYMWRVGPAPAMGTVDPVVR